MANSYYIKIELPKEMQENAMAGAGNTVSGGNSGEKNSFGGVAEAVVNKAKQMVSFSAVKSTAEQIANYRISTISLQSGATEYEERVNATYNAISQGVGALGSLVMGWISAGPAGVVVAAMDIVANGIQTAINIAQKEKVFRMQESVEGVSIGMQNVRAGIAGRRGNNQ